jgi:hypothetical protein
MIYLVTVAYKEFYRDKTKKLISSVNEFLPSAKIFILTDDTSYYDGYENVVAVQGPPCDFNPYFKANIKAFSLEAIASLVENDDFVLYLDSDCYFIKEFPQPLDQYVEYGLSTHISDSDIQMIVPADILNRAIRNKILSINPNEDHRYYVFREGFLLFKVNDAFRRFITEWKNIYYEIENQGLTHANQTFDIQNAALRAGLPINNISKPSPLRGTTVTVAVNGGVNCLV